MGLIDFASFKLALTCILLMDVMSSVVKVNQALRISGIVVGNKSLALDTPSNFLNNECFLV